jgi:hypothetical protein
VKEGNAGDGEIVPVFGVANSSHVSKINRTEFGCEINDLNMLAAGVSVALMMD